MIQKCTWSKVRAGGKAINIVIARLVDADIQFQIVNTLHVLEEILGLYDTIRLKVREYPPDILGDFQSPCWFDGETRRCLRLQRSLQKILICIIPIRIHIHSRGFPFLNNAVHLTVLHFIGDVRQLISRTVVCTNSIRIK